MLVSSRAHSGPQKKAFKITQEGRKTDGMDGETRRYQRHIGETDNRATRGKRQEDRAGRQTDAAIEGRSETEIGKDK